MRRSKLEMYVDILKVLSQRGPLKLTHIMYKANLNCSALSEYLEFLLKQGLVEERTVKKSRTVYAVTQHGLTVQVLQRTNASTTNLRRKQKTNTSTLLDAKPEFHHATLSHTSPNTPMK